MSAGRFDGQAAFRPGVGRPKGFDQQVQDIASAAHLRGIVLMKGETVVGSLEAADLCKALRAAHENTRGEEGRHAHVRNLANGIALRLGARGAVQVSRFAWNLVRGYASARKVRSSERSSEGQAAGAAADAPVKARERSPESGAVNGPDLHGSNDAPSRDCS